MRGVIKRRREYLHLMRSCTLERGFFTVTDIQEGASVPRSTAQDWINRLLDEGCVMVRERKQGRNPAHYAAISAIPSSTCRRIFTTIDGEEVEIHHECLSGACAAFCQHHHALAGGVLRDVRRDGTLLREWARLGREQVEIGLHPSPAVGVAGVEREGNEIVQYIRSIGGPAFSLTDMMARAEGVCQVSVTRTGDVVEGCVRTRALTHLIIGIDDTDTREEGATFALALALLQQLGTLKGVLPIDHQVAMLYPRVPGRTAGNSCSYIEVAAAPEACRKVKDRALLFMGDEALSHEWGMAIKRGFRIGQDLRDYGRLVRRAVIEEWQARETARQNDVSLYGGRGVIGALGAIALSGLPIETLLDPEQDIP